MVSCGYEVSVRVWQPGNVHGDCFLGKLRGHISTITSMDVLPGL